MQMHFVKMHFSLLTLLLLSPFLASAADEAAAPSKAIYYTINEPFTINFLSQSKQKARYLQIKVSLMAHDKAILDSAEANLPMLQDELLTLFSEQSYDSVNSTEGRKSLQSSALSLVKKILKNETGKDDIDALYFTSFILQ